MNASNYIIYILNKNKKKFAVNVMANIEWNIFWFIHKTGVKIVFSTIQMNG